MGKKIDLTGQRFGKWTVLELSEVKNRQTMWRCMCSCGTINDVSACNLRRGSSTNCGCERRLKLTGQSFGNWTVLRKSKNKTNSGHTMWECRCSCGECRDVTALSLRNGSSTSCGCKNILRLKGKTFGRWTVLKETDRRNPFGQKYWECECECGSVKEVLSGSLTGGASKSCGCLLLEMVGEKNPNYNPSISDEERMFNRYQLHGTNMINWRTSIFFADSCTCQGCGDNYGGNLNAHHLNAWKSFPEQRFDTANGITLCEECHTEYHHFNGRGNNTLEEFRDHIACIVGEEHVSEIEETLLSRESEIIGQEQPTHELQTT